MTHLDLPRVPTRNHESHKGDFGRALLIGGSIGMSGAIIIAAAGTLRCGAGLTTVAIPEPIWSVVAASNPALMTIPVTANRRGRISGRALEKLKSKSSGMTAVAIGPGLGQSLELQKLVCSLYEGLRVPLVVDADGLNLLAKTSAWATKISPAPRILTPHPVEFERLTGVSASNRESQILAAQELSQRSQVVIVLKGYQTAICSNGDVVFNSTGNPKMAVGGSGDLLTGIILALLCQGLCARDAAVLGCHLHGHAGDLAAASLSSPSVLPNEVLNFLPKAFESIAN